jgi:hypothetical protein
MLAPAAILIATRGQEEFPPSLQIGQRSVSSPGTEDTGPSTAAHSRQIDFRITAKISIILIKLLADDERFDFDAPILGIVN